MATVIKLKRSTTASAVPTTGDLADGEVAVNITDKKVFMRDGASIITVANFNDAADIDLSAVDQDILPDTTNTRNLGSTDKRWAELYLAGSTINLGGSTISSDGTGAINISATGATLPVNSKIEVATNTTKNIALADENQGTAIRSVPFFSNAGGLSTANAFLNFKARTTNYFVANFTLANGSSLTATADELFLF